MRPKSTDLKEARQLSTIAPCLPLTLPSAFIGLVIALSLIFLIACTAIFLLLRYSEPTERERSRRRQLSIRRRGVPHPLPIGLHDPAAPPSETLTEKLGNMFRGRRHGTGWVQASHDDEWDSADEDAHALSMKVGAAQESKRATYVEQEGTVGKEHRASPGVTPSLPYDDPFDSPPPAHGAATPSRPEYSHLQGGHAAEGTIASYHTAASRGMSGDSVHTFAGGTKFREDM
ncbi:hypothetical protein FA95DRAFT_1300066 [Auriscalpium vulgare]|uniref:Uncharacterized protein n=1 Tax=Auriscalpium vulgare TaxID=40419 RepID=A0ACB8RSH4_9AGAM|nr:hypothetical protein FA95DRAFT_1300066 [Auriscalpium vulgare]